MTIVVTKKGNVTKFNGKCGYCKCEITYDLSDIKTHDPGHRYVRGEYVDCPECNTHIDHVMPGPVQTVHLSDSKAWDFPPTNKCSYCGRHPEHPDCQGRH